MFVPLVCLERGRVVLVGAALQGGRGGEEEET